jgi:pantetheine-phosphate adenylyltransferase
MFMMTNYKYSYLSSSVVKEIGRLGGCIGELVPDVVLPDIQKRLTGLK